jgi:hypothetical protein
MLVVQKCMCYFSVRLVQRCPKTKCRPATLEIPVLVDGLDGPVELLAQSFGEEALDRNVEFLGEDDS